MISLKRLKVLGAPLFFFGTFSVMVSTIFAPVLSYAEKPPDVPADLTRLTLEQLMDIQVTSVSKGAEDFSKAPSAIFVLTQEDIRRSGVNTIPEALRMVPGVHVAQIDSSTWSISARGFNSRFANKLLVMIDGRSVYTHVFSGTFWDEQDLALEDIERIEVIRGPGGTLWGSNAVNGVINIITKNAHQTTGGQISAGGGNLDRFIGSIRYGEKIGDNAAVRVYGKYYNRNNLDDLQGNPAPDEFESGRGGMRLDWDISESNSLTLQGDVFSGEYAIKSSNAVTSLAPITTSDIVQDAQIRGGNFIARWKHQFSETSDMALQFFYNHDHRDSLLMRELLVDTYDLDFQYRFQLGDRHGILWGLGHRFMQDSFENSIGISYFPDSNLNYISNAFIQDKISLIKDELYFTIGSKFSINNFTGFEFQPNARLAWTPNDQHTVWAAVSRAVRTPNRSEDAGRFNAGAVPGPAVAVIQGQLDFESEDLLAVELGYRVRPHKHLFFDVAAFANFYDDLQSFEFEAPVFNPIPAPGHFEQPIVTRNRLSGETYGVELAATWDAADWWRLNSSFSWLEMDLKADPSSTDISVMALEDVDPEFQWSLRSHIDLSSNWEFDQTLYYVDALKSQQVRSYFRLDLRVGWHPTKDIEVSIVGQNLLDSQNQEWGNDRIQTNDRNLTERSVFGKLVLKF
jgi:iron complex outermembrane recepter protein